MMNLEKMKQKKRTNTKSRVKKSLLAATTFLCLTTPLLQTQTAYAAENTTPAITIEKPDGWKQGETTIAVTVDASHMPEGFSIAKIEAKAGKDGSWQDILLRSISGTIRYRDFTLFCCKIFLCQLHSQHSILKSGTGHIHQYGTGV